MARGRLCTVLDRYSTGQYLFLRSTIPFAKLETSGHFPARHRLFMADAYSEVPNSEYACATLRSTLAACERAVAGRCPASAAACDTKRLKLRECQAAIDDSKTARDSVSDANGRTYKIVPDGSVILDDSRVTCSKPLASMDLPMKLRGPPSCGKAHCVAVTLLGEAISWATDKKEGSRFGQLGWADRSSSAEPYLVRRVDQITGAAVKAAAGDHHSAFVDNDGRLLTCGIDRWEQLGHGAQLWKNGEQRPLDTPARPPVSHSLRQVLARVCVRARARVSLGCAQVQFGNESRSRCPP